MQYPNFDGTRPWERKSFTNLLQKMHIATKANGLLFSIAVRPTKLSQHYELDQLAGNTDFINLMSKQHLLTVFFPLSCSLHQGNQQPYSMKNLTDDDSTMPSVLRAGLPLPGQNAAEYADLLGEQASKCKNMYSCVSCLSRLAIMAPFKRHYQTF